MKNIYFKLVAITSLVVGIAMPQAQTQEQKKEAPLQVLFKNVNVFNGMEDRLYEDLDVLVTGNRIEKIGKGVSGRPDATVIDGSGKTLMPGLTLRLCLSGLLARPTLSRGRRRTR